MMLNSLYKSNEKLNEISPRIVPTGNTQPEDMAKKSDVPNSNDEFLLVPVSPAVPRDGTRTNEYSEWLLPENFDESDDNVRYVNHLEHIKEVLFPDSPDHHDLPPRLQMCVTYVEKELFQLRVQKCRIMRRQNELQYMLEDVLLQEECEMLREEASQLLAIPENQFSPEQHRRQQSLQRQIISIVLKRNSILEELHREKIRELYEDKELEREYLCHKEEWSKIPKALDEGKLMREILNRVPTRKTSRLKTKLTGIIASCTIL